MIFRRTLLSILFAGMVLGAAAGCGGESSGTETKCSLSACTVSFDRGVDAQASILGVKAKLVGVKGDQATLEVAGQRVTVPVGGETEAEGFKISVQKITKDQVTVKIAA
jgi:hypothetical protein